MTLLHGVTNFPPRGITVDKLPHSLTYHHHHPFLSFLEGSGGNLRCMPLSTVCPLQEERKTQRIDRNGKIKKSRDGKVHWSFILKHQLKQDSILKEGRKNIKSEVPLCLSQMHTESGSATPAWLTLLSGPCSLLWYFRIHFYMDHAEEVISFTLFPSQPFQNQNIEGTFFDRVFKNYFRCYLFNEKNHSLLKIYSAVVNTLFFFWEQTFCICSVLKDF